MSLEVAQANSQLLRFEDASIGRASGFVSGAWLKASQIFLNRARSFYCAEDLIADDFPLTRKESDWNKGEELKKYRNGAKYLERAISCLERASGPAASLSLKLELAQLHRANARHDEGEAIFDELAVLTTSGHSTVAALIQFYRAGTEFYQGERHSRTTSLITGEELYREEQRKYYGAAEAASKEALRLLAISGGDGPCSINHNYLVSRVLCRYASILRAEYFKRSRLEESEKLALNVLDITKLEECAKETWLDPMKLRAFGELYLTARDLYRRDHPQLNFYWNRMEELRNPQDPKISSPEAFSDPRLREGAEIK